MASRSRIPREVSSGDILPSVRPVIQSTISQLQDWLVQCLAVPPLRGVLLPDPGEPTLPNESLPATSLLCVCVSCISIE